MRKLLITSIVLVLCALQAAPVQGELVGHWKLDDGSGDVAVDSTGNGHDGTLTDGPLWVDGFLDGALQFDGTSQMVVVPYSEQLNPTEELSVALWANPDPLGSDYRSPLMSRDGSPCRGSEARNHPLSSHIRNPHR